MISDPPPLFLQLGHQFQVTPLPIVRAHTRIYISRPFVCWVPNRSSSSFAPSFPGMKRRRGIRRSDGRLCETRDGRHQQRERGRVQQIVRPAPVFITISPSPVIEPSADRSRPAATDFIRVVYGGQRTLL